MNVERFKTRQQKLRESMAAKGIDAMLIYADKQWGAHGWRDYPIQYLTGFDVGGPDALMLLRRDGDSHVLVRDKWDIERLAEFPAAGKTMLSADFGELESLFRKHGLEKGKLGVMTSGGAQRGIDILPTFIAEPLIAYFRGESVVASSLVDEIMMIRDESEIELLRASAKISDACSRRLFEVARSGVTERELFTEIWYTAQSLGAEDIHISVTTGFPNYWNHVPTDRALKTGDLLMMEITPRYRGYFTQIVRVAVVGEVSREFRDLFQFSYDAAHAAINASKAGTPIRDVFAAAEKVLANSVCGILDPKVDIGHGCAADLNGTPVITSNNELRLQPGMTIVMHPIVYFPYIGTSFMVGEYFVVRDGAPDVLTEPQRELVSLE